MSADPGATPLDAAHAALEAAAREEEAAGLRMAFYGQLLAAELHVLLEGEPEGDAIRPLVLETGAGRMVLAFDLPERMAAFLDAPADSATLSGRALVKSLAGTGIGIALNPDVAPSASVVGAEAVDWLAGQSGPVAPEDVRLAAVMAPADVPDALVAALAARIGGYGGRVRAGFLAALPGGGAGGLVLALEGVPPQAEAEVAAAIDEAVRFSGVEGVVLDVAFPPEPALARFAQVGIAFRPETPAPPRAPGSDPSRPPRLR